MVEILSKNRKYITLKMPTKLALAFNLISKKQNNTVKKIGEIEATEYDINLIKKSEKEFKKGNILSIDEFLINS